MAQGSFWRVHGRRTLVALAVLSLVAAGVYGQASYSSDVEPYLEQALPQAADFELLYHDLAENAYLYGGSDANGSPVGYVTATEGEGYWGPMIVMVAWSLDGTILAVNVAEHVEYPTWYIELHEQEFFSQYIERQYSEPLRLDEDIDVATGATGSSLGVANGVQQGRALVAEQLGDPYPVPEEPIEFGVAEIMLLVGLGMVVTLRQVPALRRFRWMRYLTLTFGLVVLGIWLSIPLSLIHFAIWPVGFVPAWQSNLLLYIVVIGVVGLAVVLAKNFYCFWLCPFVAMQEGMHFFGGRRVRPITRWQHLLRNSRYVLLWLVLLLVLLLRTPAISVYEPWTTIFSFEGTQLEWLLVGVTLFTAIFVYNFWCHYLCPVGAVMDIVLRVRMWFASLFRRLFSGRRAA